MTKKMTITDMQGGKCQMCFEKVIAFQVKFSDGFAAFLCKECKDKQVERRKKLNDDDRPLLKKLE